MNEAKLVLKDDCLMVPQKYFCKEKFGLTSNKFHLSTTLVDVSLAILKYRIFHTFNISYLGNEYV